MWPKKYPALIVGAPYGGTKKRPFKCMQMRPHGEALQVFSLTRSIWKRQEKPWNIRGLERFTWSFGAAVDYPKGKVLYADRKRIGVIGICGAGGSALLAAQCDTGVSAAARALLYNITDVRAMMNWFAPWLYQRDSFWVGPSYCRGHAHAGSFSRKVYEMIPKVMLHSCRGKSGKHLLSRMQSTSMCMTGRTGSRFKR